MPGGDHLPWFHPDRTLAEIREFITGSREPEEPDRVLATILFTDIVGSTELATKLGDRRWRDLLESHHDAVRAELARYRGREVDTAGDGFLAVFDGPARAIRAANGDRRRGPRASASRSGPASIPARSSSCRAATSAGIAVHTGARVMATAGPSEVLVSSSVRDLVAGSGFTFVDRGSHRLKGIDEERRLYASPAADRKEARRLFRSAAAAHLDEIRASLAGVVEDPTTDGLWALQKILLGIGGTEAARARAVVRAFHACLRTLQSKSASRSGQPMGRGARNGRGRQRRASRSSATARSAACGSSSSSLLPAFLEIGAAVKSAQAWEIEARLIYDEFAWFLYEELWDVAAQRAGRTSARRTSRPHRRCPRTAPRSEPSRRRPRRAPRRRLPIRARGARAAAARRELGLRRGGRFALARLPPPFAAAAFSAAGAWHSSSGTST